MKAKIKCSGCGAEMSNFNMNWGKKQLWFIVPIMLIGFFPLLRITFLKGDITKDLSINNVQTRVNGSSLEIVGVITNNSNREWSGVTVEAEFYDASGTFIAVSYTHLTLPTILLV